MKQHHALVYYDCHWNQFETNQCAETKNLFGSVIKLSLRNCNKPIRPLPLTISSYKNRQVREVALLHGPMYPREHSARWRPPIGTDLCRYVWLILQMFFFPLFLFRPHNHPPTPNTHTHTKSSTQLDFPSAFILSKCLMSLCKVMTVNNETQCRLHSGSSFAR